MELAEILSSYSVSISYEDLDEKVVREAKRRLIDSLAVAKAAVDSEPAKIVEGLFPSFQGQYLTLLGKGKVTPDLSAFYNTLLIRFWDFNDTYLSLEPLHPSDMIGGLLSLGLEKTGKELITAIAVGYEVGTRLCDSASLRKRGFDHVNYLQVAAATALSNLLGLSEKETYNAISISLIPHVALRQTRRGKLSMWKAGAAAEAVRNAVFATLLAKQGFTGPSDPFSGDMGFKLIADLDVKNFEKMGTSKILQTSIKKYPVEYHAQALVEALLSLKVEGEVRRVVVETYEAGKSILADPEKWNPDTKETADHSIPFIVASTLLRGDMWLENYSMLTNEKVRELMKKVEVVENEEYTKVYPRELPTRVTVYTDKGTYSSEVRSPKGYFNNPMSDEEVEKKARRLGLSEEVISKVWEIEEHKVKEIVA